ncbi:DUF4291 domain-containing protein [Pleionea sediminis]|uniref:DUF4291 domain-containing protein n=1 Tax=Pleionea sediminis TaxID=2569479 RepID=UPI00118671F0|nr:DUF4291 domain-containing protein [Pleionea sediminis]
MSFPERQIRAVHDKDCIRVYQAYNNAIAESALAQGTHVSPPFKMERMTWIKPSFLWMMYRAGWGFKDSGQSRILAIDITREGFEWALENSLLSHKANDFDDKEEWLALKRKTPVRIQWDPERDLHLQPLSHRSIQIGLSNEAVPLYVNEWITHISDITEQAHKISLLIQNSQLEEAQKLLPIEKPYPLNNDLKKHLGC